VIKREGANLGTQRSLDYMKVLITGANGFVGGNVSTYLTAHGFECSALDVKGVPEQGAYAARYTWDDLDALDIDAFNAVIHLAGKAHDTKNASDPQSYFDINVGLTRRVMAWYRHAQGAGGRKFIFFSSVKACADTVDGVLTEEHAPLPRTPYGQSKLEAEKEVLKCESSKVLKLGEVLKCDSPSMQNGEAGEGLTDFRTLQLQHFRTYILRPAMIHGPGNKGNLNLLVKVVQKGIPWPLAAFENQRSFTSIENVSRVLEALIRGDVESGTYQVADDEPLSTNQVIGLIAESLGRSPRLWNIPRGLMKGVARIGDLLHLPLNSERLKKLTESYVVSNKKLLRALGWEKMPLGAEEGLRSTLIATTEWSQKVVAKRRQGMKVVLSLGRLHPLKGLDLLVSAWAEVKRSSSWHLVIAGPDEQGTKEKLKRISEKLKLKWCECAGMDGYEGDADVVILGAVHGEGKWALMQRADIFVLPSRSENFGMVVGEALSCGVPVVTTAVGPWGEGGEVRECANAGMRECVEQTCAEDEHPGAKSERSFEASGAGARSGIPRWSGNGGETPRQGEADPKPVLMEKRGLIVVETSAEGIAEGLRRMMALSDAERKEMGRNGCEWVKREFSWESVAQKMLRAYELK
jgi:nucleoside-diphosphate-sugar epimerase